MNTTLMGGSATSGTFQYCANSSAPPATMCSASATGISHQRTPRL